MLMHKSVPYPGYNILIGTKTLDKLCNSQQAKLQICVVFELMFAEHNWCLFVPAWFVRALCGYTNETNETRYMHRPTIVGMCVRSILCDMPPLMLIVIARDYAYMRFE